MSKILVAAVLSAAALVPGGAHGGQSQGPGSVVFVTDRAGSSDIFSANSRGGAQTPLVATDADEADPAVAPRGAALAWASNADGTWQIYVARSGEGEGRPLTSGPRSSVDPVWSPSGRQIAFESDRTGNWEIFVMNADGSRVRNVSRRQADDFDPAWRDEKTIVFTGVETPVGSNLYRTVVGAPRPAPISRTAADESDPAYAPNRTRIALTQLYGFDYEIAVSSATSIRPRRLTRSAGLDVDPAWTAAGTHLLFTSSRGGDLEIYEVPVAGGAAVNLTRQPASNEWEAEFAVTLPKLSIRGLALHSATSAVPWFTCANPSPLVVAGAWTVVNGTNSAPPAPGDKLCGNAVINRVLAFDGADKLSGAAQRDHLEGGNHNDLFLTPDGWRDCLYGGFNNTNLATVGNLCLGGSLAAAAVHVDGNASDVAWPDKGKDLMRGINKVEP